MQRNIRYSTMIMSLIVAIISSCNPPPPTADTGEALQNIQVQTVSPQKIAGDTEEFSLQNCGGTGKLTQSLGTQGSVTKSVEMGATISVNGGVEVGIPAVKEYELKGAIETAYKEDYETANSRLDTIIMEAAPKSHVIYTIQWEKQEFSSTVTFKYNREILQTPYTFTLNVPKIGGSREEKCPGTPSAQNPQACPYQGSSDKETFQNLILAEEQAALTKDFNIVNQIFLVDATVTKFEPVETTSVTESYQKMFSETDFTQLTHYDIEVVKFTSSKAWVKASDTGRMVFISTGEVIEYTSEPGSSHYIFELDGNGCWKIAHFSKGAQNEQFP